MGSMCGYRGLKCVTIPLPTVRAALQEPGLRLDGGKTTSYLPQTCTPCIIYAFKNSLSSVFLLKKFSQSVLPCQRKRWKQSSQRGVSNHRNQSSSWIPAPCVLLLLLMLRLKIRGATDLFFLKSTLQVILDLTYKKLAGRLKLHIICHCMMLNFLFIVFLNGLCISAIQWNTFTRNYQWLSIE